MSDELLPCPHCGSDKVLVIGMADTPLNCYRWHVECQECHCTGRRFYRDEGARQEMAVAAWNRRAPATGGVPPEVREAIMQLVTLARMTGRCLGDAATVLDWLDAQPQAGQE